MNFVEDLNQECKELHVTFDPFRIEFFYKEEDWGVLLIEARNSFNECNVKMMLCATRH